MSSNQTPTRADRTQGETSRTPGRAGRTRRGRTDRGYSLIEIVITVTLLGVVVAGILTATATGIRASSVSRHAAQVETAIVNASDRVNRAPKRCDYTIYAQAAVQTQGWDPNTVTLSHEYYVPGTTPSQSGSWESGPPSSPGCPNAAPDDLLVQRVTLSITHPDGEVRRTIQVVKSDV
jgi:prepilin-type N-terminal cleavage/methylation domain